MIKINILLVIVEAVSWRDGEVLGRMGRFHPGGGGKPLQDLKFKKFCQIRERGDDYCLFPEPMSGLKKININNFYGPRACHGWELSQC